MDCSFCGRTRKEAKKLISAGGPARVCICELCVGLCVDILRAEQIDFTSDDAVPEAEGVIEERPPTCDCGASTARTTHADWCSASGVGVP